ncbi:unnamed protein product [Gongylonema pulchrum]|uniref:39S ribosomal protein L50, mitochondrial n=1 Tax=Gongylonema pulchrum TaxID=637853 RepID=A0A183DY70_9BILA|nr:unnamed protein product [Gongylonema pulchrum]
MQFSVPVFLRRIINSPYHPFNVKIHPDRWQKREQLRRFVAHAAQRVEAALAEYHFDYPAFRNMLSKAHIELDNIVLSQLAIYEPQSFKSLVMLTKQMAQEDGRAVIVDEEQKNVQTDPSLFGTPFPRSKMYPRGAAKNHQKRPRPLKITEF